MWKIQSCEFCILLSYARKIRDGGLLERGGAYLRGWVIYFLVKLYDNFLPAQSNVCKTTMHVFYQFNTTLNGLIC